MGVYAAISSRHRRKITTSRRRRSASTGRGKFSRLLLLSILAGSIWWSYRYVRGWFTPPQAVLVLGGATEREQFAAQFAKSHPSLPIWISSGAPREYSEWVFSEAGVDIDRVNLDYRAVDTLTNFTTLADDLKSRGITKIYLITSDYHMRRSQLIGDIVLGSRGIAFQPIAIPSDQPPEEVGKALRDSGRAFVWLATGYTGYAPAATRR
jgi:uncharacterized SAM-binding protein YcdF (DUF218 family)